MDEVTLGELGRRIDRMETNVTRQLDNVNYRIEHLEFVPLSVYQIQMAAALERISELEDDRKWNRRTTISAFIFPILVALIIAVVLTRGS